MPTLTLLSNGNSVSLDCSEQQSVLDVLNKACIKISNACTGHGFCGLCRVTLMSGQVSALTAIERHKLSTAQMAQGMRLACQIRPLSDLHIKVEQPLNSLAWKVLFHLDKTALNRQDDYGIAIDLGTTQLRVSLWNIVQQRRVIAWLAFNPQYRFGADILSRLTIAQNSPAHASQMRFLIQQAIKKLIPIMVKLPVSVTQLKKLRIVGNTPMLVILAEKNYQQLFDPLYWSQMLDCQLDVPSWQQQLGLTRVTDIATIAPLAGFIGSDLFAGILSSGLTAHSDCRLLIDFGTNSEMALWDGGKLWISSVPGGPAFEGSGISCGMPAGIGAIYRLTCTSAATEWSYQVIGRSKALGLCGSGLVDAIAQLLATQQLKRNGRFSDSACHEVTLPLKNQLTLTLKKQDVDIFQRAKAATAAAIVQLFTHAGLAFNDLAQMYVGGAFGQFLNIDNAQRIGLLPTIAVDKVQLMEHAALQGCELLLSTPENSPQFKTLRARTEIVNMACSLNFDDCFVENLYLQPIR